MIQARPILFSGPMVRALLDGRKTQTRRVAKEPTFTMTKNKPCDVVGYKVFRNGKFEAALVGECPYGKRGDLLWVREAGAITTNVNDQSNWPDRPHVLYGYTPHQVFIYRADGEWQWCDDDGFSSERSFWKPSIHMPRWASRLTLEITDVRVERLQDISEKDALAEGVVYDHSKLSFWVPGVEHDNKDFPWLSRATAREMYAALWDVINGSGQWLGNPWVWALTFTVHHRNVDDVLKAGRHDE